jgi:hypothetical protein
VILYYAMGGGLGHLTRARAVLHTLGLADEAVVMTASPAAADPRVAGALHIAAVPPALEGDTAAYRRWLAEWFARHRPRAVFLDTFPGGIRGEFCGFAPLAGVPVTWVARLLRWPAYAAQFRGEPPCVDRVLAVEPPSPGQAAWLASRGLVPEPLALVDPPAEPDPAVDAALAAMRREARPTWLVVHSGPADEVRALLAFAERTRDAEGADARVVVVSAVPAGALPPGTPVHDLYPATPLLPHAARVVTAAGFNAMRQAAPLRARHLFLPFPRRFDDQHLRAERAVAALRAAAT